MNIRKSVVSAAIALSAAGGLVACSTPGTVQMDGSRSELYDSVQGIAADSSLVAVVEVKSQEVLKPASDKDTAYTLSTVSVISTFSPTGLAREIPNGVNPSGMTAGSQIIVRQMGTSEMDTPARILNAGEKYLLFLTPSMLEGKAGSQFYVTGGSAGVYAAPSDVTSRADDAAFTHGPFEEGDTLPDTLTAKELSE
ncbi:hypothetical protein [Microbacterium sp. E-13]|uniref:hypothetical protein n=1 Tax=Microbacterium sp. E-13 TaxID=3404048 RepID=UPI003CF267E7